MKITKTKFAPTCHRDGTVTYWSVYLQQWVRRSSGISDADLAATGSINRERIMRHLGIGAG